MKTVFAEIIAIGDEILYGQIINTNASYISHKLDKIGIKTIRHTVVGDAEDSILEALKEAEERAEVILMTGGLGPTKDDITKKTLCKYFDTSLEIHEDILAFITKFFEERGYPMLEVNRQQAALPKICEAIFNSTGTAPAMWIEKNNKVFISMPGVPRETEVLMEKSVVPKIKDFFHTTEIYHKTINTIGKGESFMAQIIEEWEDNLPENIKLAYLPRWRELRLRLTATGKSKPILERQVEEEIQKIKPLIEKYIFGYNDDSLEEVVGKLLLEKGKTLATAESCTGGHLAHLITKVAGSSRYFEGSVVSYSNAIKQNRLGVKEETLQQYGAVSEETIREMAQNVRIKFNTSIGVATSGVAGPGGGSPEKPVGTVWVAYADATEVYAKKLQLTTDRLMNIQFTSNIVLDLIRKKLQGFI